jgi:hypothetical protein
MTVKRLCIGLGLGLAGASQAFAQTGPVREANIDVNGSLSVVALIVLPVLVAIVLALFEPWKWVGRKRRIEKRTRRRKRRSERAERGDGESLEP